MSDRKTISLWTADFRETGACLKRTTQNVTAVRRLARKQVSTFGLSQSSLRRILHEDLHFHPHKMKLVQEMIECNWPNRMKCCEVLLKNIPPDDVVLGS